MQLFWILIRFVCFLKLNTVLYFFLKKSTLGGSSMTQERNWHRNWHQCADVLLSLYPWNLYGFENQCHPNKKKEIDIRWRCTCLANFLSKLDASLQYKQTIAKPSQPWFQLKKHSFSTYCASRHNQELLSPRQRARCPGTDGCPTTEPCQLNQCFKDCNILV